MNIRAEIFGGPEARKSRLLVGKNPKQEESTALTDVMVPRLETRRTDMRCEDRPQSGEMFPILYRERAHQVELVNLSGGGAMIAANLHPNICERIELLLAEDEPIECIVRWVKNGRLGIEFAHETQLRCPEHERIELLRNVVGQAFPVVGLEAVQEQPQQPDHRAHDRHPLIWCGELHYNSHASTVRLRNVSATGAMIECTGALLLGSQVALELGEAGSFPAVVNWIVGDHAGIHFLEPFDLNMLAKSKPRVAGPTWVKPAYLECETSAQLPRDDPWNRMSVDELRTQLEGYLKR